MITEAPPPPAIVRLAEEIEKHEKTYRNVETLTGIPWMLIGAIHYREADCRFNRSIKDGSILPPTMDWELHAAVALTRWRHSVKLSVPASMKAMLEFAERYNGLGYRKRGLASPYLWAGTDRYVKGKYTVDGKFDPNVVDKQIGVAPILQELWARHVVETTKE